MQGWRSQISGIGVACAFLLLAACGQGREACPDLEQQLGLVPTMVEEVSGLLELSRASCSIGLNRDGGGGAAVIIASEADLREIVIDADCDLDVLRESSLNTQRLAIESDPLRALISYQQDFDGCITRHELEGVFRGPPADGVVHLLAGDWQLAADYNGSCPLTGFTAVGILLVSSDVPLQRAKILLSKVAPETCGLMP